MCRALSSVLCRPALCNAHALKKQKTLDKLAAFSDRFLGIA